MRNLLPQGELYRQMQNIFKILKSDSHEPSWDLRKNVPRMEQDSYCEKPCEYRQSPERSLLEKRSSLTKNGKVAHPGRENMDSTSMQTKSGKKGRILGHTLQGPPQPMEDVLHMMVMVTNTEHPLCARPCP